MDRQIIAEMVRAYSEAEEFLEAERMERLARMTDAEARGTFEQLYRIWERMGQKSGGDIEALRESQLKLLLTCRQPFERLARYRGLL